MSVEREANQRDTSPSIRRRFVKRAEHVSDSKEFRLALGSQRRVWNEAHREYRVFGEEEIPTEIQTFNGEISLPPKLSEEFFERRDLGLEARARGDYGAFDPKPYLDLIGEWEKLVLALCHKFWPPRYFPSWAGRGMHPCQVYISNCLIWDDASVDCDQWILQGPRRPFLHLFDPTDDENNFFFVDKDCEVRALREALRSLLGDQETFKLAMKAVDRRKWELIAQRPIARTGHKPKWWYVPIQPGLTIEEWRDLGIEAVALSQTEFGADLIGDLAVELRQQDNLPSRVIAEQLGVSEDTISRRLRAAGID